MAIGSGVLLPAVADNPTFPILSALAYTTVLGYRPTCDFQRQPQPFAQHELTLPPWGTLLLLALGVVQIMVYEM